MARTNDRPGQARCVTLLWTPDVRIDVMWLHPIGPFARVTFHGREVGFGLWNALEALYKGR